MLLHKILKHKWQYDISRTTEGYRGMHFVRPLCRSRPMCLCRVIVKNIFRSLKSTSVKFLKFVLALKFGVVLVFLHPFFTEVDFRMKSDYLPFPKLLGQKLLKFLINSINIPDKIYTVWKILKTVSDFWKMP